MYLFIIADMHTLRFYFFIFLLCSLSISVIAQTDEFYGPFQSWTNLQEQYHAKGDGINDDTKAIQTALNELGEGYHSPVLFIPKGTYRITSTLTMQSRTGIAIIGEDPLNTIIQWDGAKGAKMFLLNGVSYSEYGRITWDGKNKASAAVAHEWDGKIRYANSGSAHYDEIFRNLGTGIKSGANMDAEMSIRRCRFYNCSATGIALQGWNALDWWIWDCYFENCHTGVANNFPAFGAGNFHVYRSIFKNSSFADISLGNSDYFSFRNNISYNAACFIKASQFSNTSPLTIQNNLIINTKNVVMADMFTKGNTLFLDNNFIFPDSNKNYIIRHIDNYSNSEADVTMIGNRFTSKQKIIQTEKGRFINLDNDQALSAHSLPALNPRPFASSRNYPIYEVTNKMSAAEIQSLINKAASKKKRIIIHFKYGDYNINTSLQIPPGAALTFMGDGLGSILKWSGTTSDPVIVVNYPAKSVIRDIQILGNHTADGILLYDNDKTGNSIYANQLIVYNGAKNNIVVNGFFNTDIRFESLQHNYCGKGTSIQMIGTSKPAAQILKVFGCVSAGNANSYSVEKSGRILVYDAWYEDNKGTQFLSLKNNGEFILNGAKIANTGAAKAAFVNIDSFSGKVVLAQVIFDEPGKHIHFSDNQGKASLLCLGNLSWTDSTLKMYDMKAAGQNYALLNNRYNLGKGSFPIPDQGNSDPVFLKDMLTTIRNTSVLLKKNKYPNATHFTMDRVMIQGGIINFRVEKNQ